MGPEGNNRSGSFHKSIFRHLPFDREYFACVRIRQTYETYTPEYLLLQLSYTTIKYYKLEYFLGKHKTQCCLSQNKQTTIDEDIGQMPIRSQMRERKTQNRLLFTA